MHKNPPPSSSFIKYIRITGDRNAKFVEFDFAINDPTLFVELVLPKQAFEQFCQHNQVIEMTAEQEAYNDAMEDKWGLARLLQTGVVKKIICSFPRQADSYIFDELYRAGKIELEVVPQGNLACRIQAAGMGLGAVYTPTGYGTLLAEGKETRHIDGKDYVLEYPIKADVALIKAHKADRWGSLIYNKSARNFGPIMAMAADMTIVQVSQIVPLGELDPECIVTPGIFAQHVIEIQSKTYAMK